MKIKRFMTVSLLLMIMFSACYRDFNGVTGPSGPGEDAPNVANYTEISGNIQDTLRFSDSPFYVSGDLIVDSLTSLTINPGVRLYFAEGASLLVKGTLNAQGVKGYPVLFSALTAEWSGIRVETSHEDFIFHYCTVEKVKIKQENSDGYGALAIFNSNVNIRHCIFRSNTAVYGGGLSLRGSGGEIQNNIFRSNTAHAFGGAMLIYGTTADIYNNTLLQNISINYGGGIALFDAGKTSIQNNIFYRNSDNLGTQSVVNLSQSGQVFEGRYNFLGTDEQPPKFIAEGDLRLAASSPCVDAGNPAEQFNDSDGTRNDQGAFGGPYGDWWADESDPELDPSDPPESEPVEPAE